MGTDTDTLPLLPVGTQYADSHIYMGTHIDRLTHKHIIKNEIQLFKQI